MVAQTSDGKRFTLTVAMNITETKDGVDTLFSDSTVNYRDLPMDGVLLIEGMMIDVLQNLNDLGVVAAEVKGEKLPMVKTVKERKNKNR